MLTLIKKAAGGLKTTTATAIHNATDFIATKATREGTTGSFHAKPCAGIDRRQFRAVKGCATFRSTPELLGLMLENIVSNAANLPVSEVFSRPNTLVYGRDGLVRKAGRMTLFMFSTSRPPVALEKAASGFQSHNGAKAMTTVNTITTPKTGTTAALARQQAIENALSTALYFIRLPATDSGLRAATGRAIRAASMLKQACAEISNGERV